MKRHSWDAGRYTLVLFSVVFLAMLGAAWDVEAIRIDQISHKAFEDTIQHLEWSCGGYGLTVVAQLDYRNILAKIDVHAKKSRMLEVMRRAWLKTIVERDPAAALDVPIRIYVYERDDGRTVVSYYLPSATFAAHGEAEWHELGQELDDVLRQIVHMATK
ncbi:MAG: DUF302 domain-containing protein [Candidatus Entotheonellia bacterium]